MLDDAVNAFVEGDESRTCVKENIGLLFMQDFVKPMVFYNAFIPVELFACALQYFVYFRVFKPGVVRTLFRLGGVPELVGIL